MADSKAVETGKFFFAPAAPLVSPRAALLLNTLHSRSTAFIREDLRPGPHGVQRHAVLSPHEIATLMLVKAAPDQIDLRREELATLLVRQLVALEQLASGHQRPRLTRDGDSVLQAVTRKRKRE